MNTAKAIRVGNALRLSADQADTGITISEGTPGRLLLEDWGPRYRITNDLDRKAAELTRDFIDEWLKMNRRMSKVILGSVWATKDRQEVVVVVELNPNDQPAVVADGWVSYGTRGTVCYDRVKSFLQNFPTFIFELSKDEPA